MREPHDSNVKTDKKLVLQRETFRCLDGEALNLVRGAGEFDGGDGDQGPDTCMKYGTSFCGKLMHCGIE